MSDRYLVAPIPTGVGELVPLVLGPLTITGDVLWVSVSSIATPSPIPSPEVPRND